MLNGWGFSIRLKLLNLASLDNMKNIPLLVLSLFSLSGCVSIDGPKISHPSGTNTSGLIGVWTSKLAVSESSFQINPDNSGKYCMSILNSNSVNSFKIEDGIITLNEGSKFKIINDVVLGF